jgi:hypothetical protein
MFTVAPARAPVNDLLTETPGDLVRLPPETRGATLLVLVGVAVVVFSALRAVLAAIVALVAPLFALLRSFVVVVGLIVLLGMSLVGRGSGTEGDSTDTTPPTPTSVRARPAPVTPPPANTRPSKPTPTTAVPSVRSSLPAPGR